MIIVLKDRRQKYHQRYLEACSPCNPLWGTHFGLEAGGRARRGRQKGKQRIVRQGHSANNQAVVAFVEGEEDVEDVVAERRDSRFVALAAYRLHIRFFEDLR